MSTLLILGATLFVAYANGADDNFNAVATLFGLSAGLIYTVLSRPAMV